VKGTVSPGRPAGVMSGRGRVLATLAVGVALLAAGCGGGGGSPHASRPLVHQELVAFAQCMRSHGVPDWPDPLPQGGFPRTGDGQNSGPQAAAAMSTCKHLLPPVQPMSAAQQAQVLAQDLKWARCMRGHGFPGISDPSVGPHAGTPVITAPPGFDPGSPQAQAAAKACKRFEGPFILAQGGAS
jgi:hypothetical protein